MEFECWSQVIRGVVLVVLYSKESRSELQGLAQRWIESLPRFLTTGEEMAVWCSSGDLFDISVTQCRN
jgi:hypothetical protein